MPIPKPNEFTIATCRASMRKGSRGSSATNSAYTQYVYFPYISGYCLDLYNIPVYPNEKNKKDNKYPLFIPVCVVGFLFEPTRKGIQFRICKKKKQKTKNKKNV